jgi:hypothetical protein
VQDAAAATRCQTPAAGLHPALQLLTFLCWPGTCPDCDCCNQFFRPPTHGVPLFPGHCPSEVVGLYPSAGCCLVPSWIRFMISNNPTARILTRASYEIHRIEEQISFTRCWWCVSRLFVKMVVFFSDIAFTLRPYLHEPLELLLLMFLSFFRHLALVFLVDTHLVCVTY